ncbi:GNAT family N-acetyltransferase, putative [Talaromyces stipitatus ATCC 10500]|uniref:GNAT family N-acetyltransferase, putative n=1 Tax=Talaromyces stipitatus (strain ATCC 10500 / CBS 375.48 / QM 6759 / NRRL 1006) TaxID=441959 RepID=B8MHZ4_TALSN|nr:GNAT family N-acetyltransferase, putative [Talaromyces stipitatus ATCC 10500]EED17156.1 GNAT family N-acetyltransferase, putative [Talaromyces stipitatus ATCC 10500]
MAQEHKMDQSTSTDATKTKIDFLADKTDASPFTLRPFRAGDLGYMVHRQGVFYDEQYQWGIRFEGLVARIVGDFVDSYDPSKECCWIAENKSDGAFLGGVMVVKDKESVTNSKIAKLRLLYVEPKSQGMGLGTVLVRQCTRFAREAGYTKIGLWTQSYKLVRSEKHESFGVPLTGEYWELTL